MPGSKRPLHPSFRPARDYLIALAPLYGMAFWLYGYRVLILAGCAVVTCFVCDLFAALVQRKRYDVSDLSSYTDALIFTALVPASSRYEIVVITTAFIVLLAKNAFGGYGCYPFNPSMFGFAFAALCWPGEMFLYPEVFSSVGIGFDSGAALVEGVAGVLQQGAVPSIDATDLLLGNYPGPMGATFCVIILACLGLLIAHRTVSFHIPVAFLATCAAWAALLPRVQTGIIDSLIYELFSGGIIFCAVFVTGQPDNTPKHPAAKLLYALVLGVATMFYRTFGAYEEGACFAILLVNPLAPAFDRLVTRKRRWRTKGGRRAL